MTLPLRFLSVLPLVTYATDAWASGDPRAVVVIALVVMAFHVLMVTVVLATKNVLWRLKALFGAGYLVFTCGWWYVWYLAYTGAHLANAAFDPFWLVVAMPLGVAVAGRIWLVRIGKARRPSQSE